MKNDQGKVSVVASSSSLVLLWMTRLLGGDDDVSHGMVGCTCACM